MSDFDPSELNVNENITVKFKINDYHTVAQVYPKDATAQFILSDIAEKFQINTKYVHLFHDAIPLRAEVKLFELCHNEYQIIDFELRLNDLARQFNEMAISEAERIHLDCDVYYRHYQLPDFFSVYIPASDSGEMSAKGLIVVIFNTQFVKPYLGGYVHKKTYIEYHNASTQTGPIINESKLGQMITRDTQTAETKTMTVNSRKERAMQAFEHAVTLIPKLTGPDYFIKARKYRSYDQLEGEKLNKIILIQRNFRRYLLEKRIRNAAAEWRRLYGEQQDREQQRKERLLMRFREDCVVKAFPRTKADFDILFAQLQKWKDSEIVRINEMYSGAPRTAELHLMLEKEISLLNGIEKQRSKVRQYLQEQKIEKDLDEMGRPIKWIGYRDMVCEMDLLRTQNIRTLNGYRRRLKAPMVKGERMKFLCHLQEMLGAETNLPIVKELIGLLLCEQKLMSINVKDDALDTLRQRQNALFVAFIKELKVEKTGEDAEKRMCSQCKVVRPTTAFEIHTRQREVNICKSCNRLRKAPIDVSVYRAILRAIRRDERKQNGLSSSAFIVQEEDIREIMETLWHGHSALSQCDNRKDLRLPRWNKALDWSPWNCICLTESEAIAHLKIGQLDQVYDSYFLDYIRSKHELAKTMFKNLKTIDTDFVESGHWWDVGIAQRIV